MFTARTIPAGITGRAARVSGLACLLLLAVLPAAARAAISLDVQLARTQVYFGEAFLLTVVVNGADNGLPTPDLSALKADTRLLGSRSNSSRTFAFINGTVTRKVTEARLFAFEVKPREAGTFQTGPIALTFNGQTYTTQGANVGVTGIQEQEVVQARIGASSQSVMVDEPFTVTLTVDILALPPPHADFEPLFPGNPPHIECDCLGQAQIAGLQTPNLQDVLGGLIQQDPRGPAFTINNYRQNPSPFFGNRALPFRLPRKPVVIRGKPYHEYSLTLPYTPQQEGDYTFGPLTFKGPVIIGAEPNGNAIPREVFCVGPAVTVRVVPPPETNRPDWFIGSVGSNLHVHAELDAAVCKVGDPLTLMLDITGAISLGNLRPPVLNLQPELTADFRIYDDNVEGSPLPSGKRLRYRVRPIREGTLEFPPIRVAWFDTASHTYQTVRTEPIPVQARPNTQIVSDPGETNRASQTTRLRMAAAETLPAAITVSPSGTQTASFLPEPALLALLGLSGPAIVCLYWAVALLIRNRKRIADARRRSRALPRALRLLRAAARSPAADAGPAARALRAYLSERLAVAGAALTGPEAEALLQIRGVPQPVAAACGDLLDRLDRMQYQPDASQADLSSLTREALDLLPKVESALHRPPTWTEETP